MEGGEEGNIEIERDFADLHILLLRFVLWGTRAEAQKTNKLSDLVVVSLLVFRKLWHVPSAPPPPPSPPPACSQPTSAICWNIFGVALTFGRPQNLFHDFRVHTQLKIAQVASLDLPPYKTLIFIFEFTVAAQT